MTLTPQQKDICNKRLKEHQHGDYQVSIELSPDFTLERFYVMEGVFRPETTSGFYLARYLVNHKENYSGKKVLDLGCGSGIQGIVASLNGAKSVSFSDISELATENAQHNTRNYGLAEKSLFACGDLFENIHDRYDVIIFNHPFFDSKPDMNHPITRAWFDEGGKSLNKFLKQASDYLSKDGMIIMPFFQFAGDTNNPMIKGEKIGYHVRTMHTENIDDNNLQKGEFVVFSLTKYNPNII